MFPQHTQKNKNKIINNNKVTNKITLLLLANIIFDIGSCQTIFVDVILNKMTEYQYKNLKLCAFPLECICVIVVRAQSNNSSNRNSKIQKKILLQQHDNLELSFLSLNHRQQQSRQLYCHFALRYMQYTHKYTRIHISNSMNVFF